MTEHNKPNEYPEFVPTVNLDELNRQAMMMAAVDALSSDDEVYRLEVTLSLEELERRDDLASELENILANVDDSAPEDN